MKMFLAFMLVMSMASQAFADYGYHRNKYGTGYYRDDSNDGNQYNNANYLGMNNNSSGTERQRLQKSRSYVGFGTPSSNDLV